MTTFEEAGGWPALFNAMADPAGLSHTLLTGALRAILSGEAADAHIAGFVMGLKARGEQPEEIAALVEVMYEHAVPLSLGDAGEAAIDIVGTGGATTGHAAMNVSTMASFVVAGSGVVVCKHGNRKASSTSGSTDVLEELGVAVDLDAKGVARCVDEVGLGFAFARSFHPAMRHAGPVRAQLGVRSVFNLLGPLSNPGRVTRMVVGVSDAERAPLMMAALSARGLHRAMVVSGNDGLDELTLTGSTAVLELHDGAVTRSTFEPSDVGMDLARPEDLAGGTPSQNATLARQILDGATGPRRDLVVLNAAAGLVVADAAPDLASGVALAAESIDTGRAGEVLELLVAVSNRAE